MAHDIVRGTSIEFAAVLVSVQDGSTQEFTTTGGEFKRYKEEWMQRVENYWGNCNVVSNGNSD